MTCNVKIIWDKESDSWYTDADAPLNMVLTSGSFDALVERVRMAAPEMLELNEGYIGPFKLIFEVIRIDEIELAS